jgi:hypothetical protein
MFGMCSTACKIFFLHIGHVGHVTCKEDYAVKLKVIPHAFTPKSKTATYICWANNFDGWSLIRGSLSTCVADHQMEALGLPIKKPFMFNTYLIEAVAVEL